MRKYLEAPSAVETARSVSSGRISAAESIRSAIHCIQELEPEIRAWEVFDPTFALEQARRLDLSRAEGRRLGLLAGVPLGVKDIFQTEVLPTAFGSVIYKNYQATQDAQVVADARVGGAVVMGKTVTTEFAFFSPGPTANPWNTAHTPGGSSSGSAAAVASGMVPLAFGSQTAGSTIRPASYCGVFALKPTFGAFSLEGVRLLSRSLDTLGWMARDADDLELMRCALTGGTYEPLVPPAPSTLRLGSSLTHEAPFLTPHGALVWQQGVSLLADAKATVTESPMPDVLSDLYEAQKTVMAWEAAQSLAAEVRDHRALLSEVILSLIQAGSEIPESRYEAALAAAVEGRRQMTKIMRGKDALAVPAAPGEAPCGLQATGDPAFCRVWTLLGLPCVNVPGLLGPNGLPIGLQLVGHPGKERELLAIAASVHNVLLSAGD
jgi:Asp-tRNA(Asn)/Glu-tRNA(Gln) amidotransferase A subunit family amidase